MDMVYGFSSFSFKFSPQGKYLYICCVRVKEIDNTKVNLEDDRGV